MVTLAVVATVVLSSQAPPAKTTLQPLHFQMPMACLLTEVLPQWGQTYLACCWSSNFLMIFLRAPPYLVPYLPTMPTFLVLLVINNQFFMDPADAYKGWYYQWMEPRSNVAHFVFEFFSGQKTVENFSMKGFISSLKRMTQCDKEGTLERITYEQLYRLGIEAKETLRLLWRICEGAEDANGPVKIGLFKGFRLYLEERLRDIPHSERQQMNVGALMQHDRVDYTFLDLYLKLFYDQEFVAQHLIHLRDKAKSLLSSEEPKDLIRGLKMVSGLGLQEYMSDDDINQVANNRTKVPFAQVRFFFDRNPNNVNRVLDNCNQSSEMSKLAVDLLRVYKLQMGDSLRDDKLMLGLSKKSLYYFYKTLPHELVETRYSNNKTYLKDFVRYLESKGKLKEAIGVVERNNLDGLLEEKRGVFRPVPSPNRLISHDAFGPTESSVLNQPQEYICLRDFGIEEEDVSTIETLQKLEQCQEQILASNVVSFDCETSGGMHSLDKVVLETLQLSTCDKVFVVDVPKLRKEPQFIDLVDKVFYQKGPQTLVGLNVKSDKALMNSILKTPHAFKEFVDLESANEGLSKLALKHFSKPLSKYEQMSGWSIRPFRRAQLHYAALDAHILIRLLAKMR